MKDLKYWLWLSALAQVSLNSKASLLEAFGDIESLYNAGASDLRSVPGVSEAEIEKLSDKSLDSADKILEECDRQKIKIRTLSDPNYPELLRNIYAPPEVLYLQGELFNLNDNVLLSVIGTRNSSEYGVKMARNIAYEYCRCGGTVVSLLTEGAGMGAVTGAIEADGKIIGVLGTPHELAPGSLSSEILARGMLISEYAPGVKPMKSFFRARNRVASGISAGVVVTEAPEKSGTRLFVAEAVEQGKDVFAVPGNADSENSLGTIRLLKEGAGIASHGWEIAEELSRYNPGCLSPEIHESRTVNETEEMKEKTQAKKAKRQKKVIDIEKKQDYIDLSDICKDLNPEQSKIVECVNEGAHTADEIIEATGFSAGFTLSQLTLLEIKNVLHKEPGTGYSIIKKWK